MKQLPEVDSELVAKDKKFTKTLIANAKLKIWLLLTVVVLILGTITIYCLQSNITQKIESKLNDKYSKQITSLQDKLEDTESKYQEKLTNLESKYEKKLKNEQENYEKKLTNAEKSYAKEIADKDSKIEDQQQRINDLEHKVKVQFNEIESEIKAVGKLTTLDYYYTCAGTHEDVKKFFNTDIKIAFTKNSFDAQWDGVVAMGVDLSKVKLTTNEKSKVITVSVPEADIFYHEVYMETFEVKDEKNNIFNPIDVVDYKNFTIQYKNVIIKKIEERELLKKAKENAKNVIGNIINAVPGVAGQYTIKYQ